MILPRLGSWSISGGALFVWHRIYWHGYRWTPFCRIFWRYCTERDPQGRRTEEEGLNHATEDKTL